MTLSPAERELILRYVDRAVLPGDEPRLTTLLTENAGAREFLLELSEVAVLVADRGRVANASATATEREVSREASGRANQPAKAFRRRWLRGLATLVLCLVVGGAIWGADHFWSSRRRIHAADEPRAWVAQVGGLVQLLNGRGQFINPLLPGQPLRAGDLLRTHSSDAWIELRLSKGGSDAVSNATAVGSLTISGHSGLKFLDAPQESQALVLERGSLWIDSSAATTRNLSITTMVAEIRASRAIFSLQTSADEAIVRVQAGEAAVIERLTSRRLTVGAGQEVAISLLRPAATRVIPQATPVSQWKLRLPEGREALYGTILSHRPGDLRIRAAPLLWPVPHRDPELLHVVAIAAWQCSESPLVLTAGARLRYRGHLQQPQFVRFGFSTARMRQRGFAGKFEIDIPADRLVATDGLWEVDIPLSDFHPLEGQTVASPLGLELTDVYALTITTDAGLEVRDIELIPENLPVPEDVP